MKKVKVLGRNATSPSQNKVKYELTQISREYSALAQPVVFVFSNRWSVEVGKSVISPGSQATSKMAFADSDLGSESFLNQIAASQIGVARFLETRLLSSVTLKRRALEALKRAEEQRNELLSHCEDVEFDY